MASQNVCSKPSKSVTSRREFLQLADKYKPDKHKIAGFYVSAKLDGTRCFWDGGVSRGVLTREVPWASVVDPKTGSPKAKVKPVATGLWSRYGNPIIAPDSFLDTLPKIPLDGELWAGEGNFQLCRSICAGDTPDPRFDQIEYAVYSSPSWESILRVGEVKNANMRCHFTGYAMEWLSRRLKKCDVVHTSGNFENELAFLRDLIPQDGSCVYLHRQLKLSSNEIAARDVLESFLNDVLERNGEGVVLRDPATEWTPKRHKGVLKHKPYEDAEAEIVGYVSGREGKQGNVLGRIGALVCRLPNGTQFEIGTGLTMEDRKFQTEQAYEWACQNPEEEVPERFEAASFKRGQTITFKYRELSDDGVPKEGRYFRARDEE